VIPHQELYEAIVNANSAMKLYEAFQKQMKEAAAMIAPRHTKKLRVQSTTMTLVAVGTLVFIVGVVFTGPGALGAATLAAKIVGGGFGTLIGGGWEAHQISNRLDTLKMERNVKQCKIPSPVASLSGHFPSTLVELMKALNLPNSHVNPFRTYAGSAR